MHTKTRRQEDQEADIREAEYRHAPALVKDPDELLLGNHGLRIAAAPAPEKRIVMPRYEGGFHAGGNGLSRESP